MRASVHCCCQATKSGDACATMDYAALLAATGREDAALKMLRGATAPADAGPGASGAGVPPADTAAPGADANGEKPFTWALALAPALLLLRMDDLHAARALLVDGLLQEGPSAGATGGAAGQVSGHMSRRVGRGGGAGEQDEQ
eukprot:319388-Chlamydomonas_euryale.AAC.1